jgi:hypothetical protein
MLHKFRSSVYHNRKFNITVWNNYFYLFWRFHHVRKSSNYIYSKILSLFFLPKKFFFFLWLVFENCIIFGKINL